MAGRKEVAKLCDSVREDGVQEVFAAIVEIVATGEDVRIAGFGTFSKQHKEGRDHVENALKPGTFYDIAAKDVLKFKQSKEVNLNPPKAKPATGRRR